MPRITKRLVDGLTANGREQIVWDDEIAGFGVRVTATGSKAYILKYRVGHGRSAPIRKPTIGRHGDVTADEARRIAKSGKRGSRSAATRPRIARIKPRLLPSMIYVPRTWRAMLT